MGGRRRCLRSPSSWNEAIRCELRHGSLALPEAGVMLEDHVPRIEGAYGPCVAAPVEVEDPGFPLHRRPEQSATTVNDVAALELIYLGGRASRDRRRTTSHGAPRLAQFARSSHDFDHHNCIEMLLDDRNDALCVRVVASARKGRIGKDQTHGHRNPTRPPHRHKLRHPPPCAKVRSGSPSVIGSVPRTGRWPICPEADLADVARGWTAVPSVNTEQCLLRPRRPDIRAGRYAASAYSSSASEAEIKERPGSGR